MNYLIFYDHEIGTMRRVRRIVYDPSDDGRCGEYHMQPEVRDWCNEHVGRVDVDHEESNGSCRLLFVDEGAAMLFAMRFNVEFAFRNV